MKGGKLKVFKGCMYAGKSTRLMMEAQKKSIVGKTIYFKVNFEISSKRTKKFATHCGSGATINGYEIPKDFDIIASQLINEEIVAIFIDEYQFLDKDLVHNQVINFLNMGIDVFIAGLSLDWRGQAFRSMAYACCEADEVVCLTAVCNETKENATHTWKVGGDLSKTLEQGDENYSPVSRKVFYEKWKKEKAIKE